MKKFIVIYHAPAAAEQEMASTSPEEQEKGMQAWMDWAKKCGDKLVDLGSPLMNGVQINPDSTTIASTKEVAGFSILQAENMDDAKALLKGHPHLAWAAGCTIELHETMPLPGM